MEWLKDDLKRYSTKGLVLLVCLTLIAATLLAISASELAISGLQKFLVWLLLTIIVGKISSQHALTFFKNGSGASFGDALIFLAVVLLSPYHATLLGVVDMFLSSWRLR